MKRIITALSAIVLLASCNQYKTTPSGFKYKVSGGGSKETLKQGQFVKLNMEYKIMPKDSVLGVSTYGHIPMYLMIDSNNREKHSFLEIINKTAPGDKIEFLMSVDTLKNQGKLEYNNVFHARDMIKGRVEILKSFANSAEAQADFNKEIEVEKAREIKALQDHVAKKGIKVQSSPSGALVAVENAGEAVKGDSGRRVLVMYRGYSLSGVEFDSNMKGAGSQPLTVDIGAAGVIKGLEESLRFFGKGGKGKIFIPALLAYGQGGNPPAIQPYENIVFDIEVVDVVALPAQGAPGTQMPK